MGRYKLSPGRMKMPMSTTCWLSLVVAIILCWHAADGSTPKRPSSFQFYMRDTLQNKTAPNLNTAFIVGAPNGNLTGFKFGAVVVFDDPLTEGPDLTTKRIGRGQGTYTYDNFYNPGFDALMSFSALIDTHQFNGTINMFGADRLTLPTRDISVVGGTGDFELARGIATITTFVIDGDTFIVRFKLRLYY
ncbi:hypothetical protein O6H91_11G099300 [Diphasiastrum complanatum]|uniref:Uncharacterized protein n=1 Tax=Diphasiastrum complanatum TaxID=34168 RepID=A0ACC2CC83_DIPCM|nr:hypothetical protein O6H91_Y156900 [Diphasiastrum complanatum]KAJ7539542.1 hypothetical protein O6H91_11G099300 [Diphasiastrum complanatum]